MTMEELKVCLSKMIGKKSTWVDGSLLVAMGDGTEINLEYLDDRDELYMYGFVIAISEQYFEKYAISLLKANLFGKDTGGSAVLAYDPDESRVVLWDKVALAGMSREEFRERFSYMYLSILHWSNKIRQDLLGGDIIGVGARSATITG